MLHVIENCYFNLTTAGHLLGEYSNLKILRARPECAFRDDRAPHEGRKSFEGTFTTTWYEPADGSITAKIVIQPKSQPAEHATQFTLKWTDVAAQHQMYQGEAMLNDGQLVGNYWSVDS